MILLTAVLGTQDPRLKDEALDWCSRHHALISVNRLKTLANALGDLVIGPFSQFAATLNSVSTANWPLLISVQPQKFTPSKKSKPPQFDRPSMLLFRLRELFGVGARADLIAFFLDREEDVAIADCVEIGYTKRALADVLDAFVQAGICEVRVVRNQQRYTFSKREWFQRLLEPLPEQMFPWRTILEVVLKLRASVLHIENKSDGVKAVELSKVLQELAIPLQRLGWVVPSKQSDLNAYWVAFGKWVLRGLESLK